jgi:hypothetical protein
MLGLLLGITRATTYLRAGATTCCSQVKDCAVNAHVHASIFFLFFLIGAMTRATTYCSHMKYGMFYSLRCQWRYQCPGQGYGRECIFYIYSNQKNLEFLGCFTAATLHSPGKCCCSYSYIPNIPIMLHFPVIAPPGVEVNKYD